MRPTSALLRNLSRVPCGRCRLPPSLDAKSAIPGDLWRACAKSPDNGRGEARLGMPTEVIEAILDGSVPAWEMWFVDVTGVS
jgi:hypothetical protein